MATTVTKSGSNTTLSIVFTGLSTKADPVLDMWAKFAYTHGYTTAYDEAGNKIDFDSLTKEQKEAAINARAKAIIKAEATSQKRADEKVRQRINSFVEKKLS